MRYDPRINRCNYFDYGYMRILKEKLFDIHQKNNLNLDYHKFIKCSIEYYFNLTIDEILINRQ